MVEEEASGRNQRLSGVIAEAGRSLGLRVDLEYPIPGGRIDVVWLWESPGAFPFGLPLVGFEIESSWRTRKHIKGDLLNLIELQPALGIIVLAGGDPRVKSTKEFARALVARHVTRIEVWDEDDLAALVGSTEDARAQGSAEMPAVQPRYAVPLPGGGKYRAITQWLVVETRSSVDASFREIEEVLGFRLPPSSRAHTAHWHGYKGSAVARSIMAAGWRARRVDLGAERVTLERVGTSRT